MPCPTRVAALHHALRLAAKHDRQIMRLPSLRRLYTAIIRDPQAKKLVHEAATQWAKDNAQTEWEARFEGFPTKAEIRRSRGHDDFDFDDPCPNAESAVEDMDDKELDNVLQDDNYGMFLYSDTRRPPRTVEQAFDEWFSEAEAIDPNVDEDDLYDLINDTVQATTLRTHEDTIRDAIRDEWSDDWEARCEGAADDAEYNEDPMAYHGVSWRDFI